MANIPTNRTPPHPNSTTAENAAAAAKANEAKKKAAEQEKGATFVETKKNPAVLRSKFNLRDPDSGVYLNQGELAEVPHVSPWLRSQINAGIVEVVSGDEDAPEYVPPAAPPGSHASSQKLAAGTEENGVVELTQLEGESDEDFEKRKAAAQEANE